ncbi:MAG: S-methyl-5'-thioadenosine phosphorylase [archaeon]
MIGLIGGSGFENPSLFKLEEEKEIKTEFGKPSGKIKIGTIAGKKVAFISRHGEKHTINPTNVNYRANIMALKKLGVKKIIASSAVGSLKEEFKPGEFAFVNQFIDRTTKRTQTFYDKKQVCHISVAEPFCSDLREKLIQSAKELNLEFHEKATCVVIEGPRFSTKAESNLFRSWNADLIGMTLVPEAVLAREAEICYATIAMITDYDVWKEKPVDVETVLKRMKENSKKLQDLIKKTIPLIDEKDCECNSALKNALI